MVRHVAAKYLPLSVQGHNVDTHGEHSDVDEPILQLDTFWQGLSAENTADGLSEMASVVRSLEPDQVRTEYTSEQLASNGQTTEDFRRREGDVHKESDRCIGKFGAKHLREQHEMVVVYPDDIAVLVRRNDGVCKSLVDGDVLFVRCGLVEQLRLGCVRNSIMKTGPKDLVTELVVAALEFGIGNPNG